jgi:hypothetical protein
MAVLEREVGVWPSPGSVRFPRHAARHADHLAGRSLGIFGRERKKKIPDS